MSFGRDIIDEQGCRQRRRFSRRYRVCHILICTAKLFQKFPFHQLAPFSMLLRTNNLLKFNYSTISQKCNHNLSIVLMKWGVFCRYIRVSTGPGCHFVFAVIRTPEMPKNNVGFSLVQRKWAAISVNQDIDVKAFRFNTSSSTEFLDTVTLEVDFLAKKT